MKDVVRINENDYIFFDVESTGDLYLPRIVAFDLSPEDDRDVFIIKIINLVNPPWCMWPNRVGDRTGFTRWFSSGSRCVV